MSKIFIYIIIAASFILVGCEKFVAVKSPITKLSKYSVFEADGSATSAMVDIYYSLTLFNSFVATLPALAGLSSDELIADNNSTASYRLFVNNNLHSLDSYVGTLWGSPYEIIYRANSILEALPVSPKLSENLVKRLEGEAKFVRSFCYFYLTNMFGKVPLVLTTDYQISGTTPRTEITKVYAQMVNDLLDAERLLSENYQTITFATTTERARPNKFAARAMLSRVQLYNGNWLAAEQAATSVIEHTLLYEMIEKEKVFLKNSREAIWQLSRDNSNTPQPNTFGSVSSITLRDSMVLTFESTDQRRTKWINVQTSAGRLYYFPSKYKAPPNPGATTAQIVEYDMVLRVGELYLIRAEARARQEGKLADAIKDLNWVRSKAGLNPTTATNRDELLLALEKERYFELFSEWGDRWFNIKRTNRVDEIMKMSKGNQWVSTASLFPIPDVQIRRDPAMINDQNPGYN